MVQEKKTSRDFNAENLYHGVAAGTKRTNILLALMYVSKYLVALFLVGKGLLNTLGTLLWNLTMLWGW